MKGLIKLALVSGLGLAAFKGWREWMGDDPPSDDRGPVGSSGIAPNAWDMVDEQSDESFPASDPPGNY